MEGKRSPLRVGVCRRGVLGERFLQSRFRRRSTQTQIQTVRFRWFEQYAFEGGRDCATLTHMERVGIRALQQHASAVLRRVPQGEPVEVTDRGHAVVFLVPAARRGLLAVLTASGRLRAAEGDLFDLGAPLAVKHRVTRASRRLAQMRARER